MRKRFLLVITITLVMFLGVGLTGCSDSETENISEVAESDGLIQVSDTRFGVGNIYTFYDPDTNVMYMAAFSGNANGGCQLTVMVNPDGTPKLYEPQN